MPPVSVVRSSVRHGRDICEQTEKNASTFLFYFGALAHAGGGRETHFVERTDVEFGDLDDGMIRAYVETGDPFDKAGGYGIQGKAGAFVSAIDGCYYNVVGLPLHRLSREIAIFLPTTCEYSAEP